MKKKLIYLSIILVLVISVVTLSSIYKSKDNKYNKEYNTISKKMAIMIKEEGATDYVQSNSKDIPKGNYVLNRDKSYCKNNGKIGNYDSSLGKVSFSFIGTDSCYLYFDYKKETIKLGNAELVVNSETPDFSKVATTNEGLFKADDDYTATTGMKSYYFRGAVDNNWVKFGKDSSGKDIYWRIIRINGDGSIRMIYSGVTPPTESTKVVMTGIGTTIGINDFNSISDGAEHVGYMYTAGEQHGNGTSSDIKTRIDNWYKTTTLETDSTTKALVSQDQIFCNDRSASSTQTGAWTSTGANYYYGAYGRLNTNKAPILTCPEESDKFTSKESSIEIGNKRLEYPVGLITADEVAMAGGKYKTDGNKYYYLYTNSMYWLGSPYYFASGDFAYEPAMTQSGTFYDYAVRSGWGVRPVISLSSEAKLTGDGTWNNVFEVEKKGYETILANNTVNETTPDFSKVATTNEGLFKADDDYTATTGMKSYYFRGAVDNNWVKFGKDSTGKDIYWRIIRINGDGSIRMIYSGTTAPTENTKVVMTGEGTQIGTSAFNSSSDKAEYVGYMYTLGQQNGNSTDSTIKTTIDNWYKTTTLETDSATKSLVSQNQIFCNDRSASSTQTEAWTSTGNFYYGAYGRLNVNKMPLLTCPTESDKFTSKNSSIGNKALDYPVGLITADEVAMAGGAYNTSNSSYYLCTNQYYWSGSPFHFVDELFSSEFQVISSTDLLHGGVKGSIGIRPVISLSSKAKLSGSGTYNDVYTVS